MKNTEPATTYWTVTSAQGSHLGVYPGATAVDARHALIAAWSRVSAAHAAQVDGFAGTIKRASAEDLREVRRS